MATANQTLLTETRASVSDIAAKVTGTTATMSAQRKVRRWIEDGVTVCGAIVKLDAVRVGGRYVTSFEAYERFIEACNTRPELSSAAPERTPRQRQRDSDAAAQEVDKILAAAGVRALSQKRANRKGS